MKTTLTFAGVAMVFLLSGCADTTLVNSVKEENTALVFGTSLQD